MFIVLFGLIEMSLKFYYDIFSQPCRAVYVFLKLNNIPFEKHSVNLIEGEHRKKAFKEINPLGLVPVIVDDGFVLRESVGILRYLVRKMNLPEHWYPKETKAQARIDEFLEWQHFGLRAPLAFFFRITKLRPMLTGKSPLESDINRCKDAMVNSCNIFEKVWLCENKRFLFGNELSIADLLAVMELEQPRMAGYNPRNGRPKLKAYMEQVRAATNPYYDEACQMLYSFIESKL